MSGNPLSTVSPLPSDSVTLVLSRAEVGGILHALACLEDYLSLVLRHDDARRVYALVDKIRSQVAKACAPLTPLNSQPPTPEGPS